MAPSTSDELPFPTRNDIDQDVRQETVRSLNQALADTTDLQTQVKHAHWNVKGMQFRELHLLFDEQAELLAEHADVLAERLTALGGRAHGTARQAASNSQLEEFPADAASGTECVTALADRFAAHADDLREWIDIMEENGDLDTADLYTELSREMDKQLWFLEAHIQGPDAPVEFRQTAPGE